MAEHFGNYSHYYDLLYCDKDYVGEAEYVLGLIKRFHPDANSVLELGCGTGRHADLIANAGFQVTGVELSDTMRSQAEKRMQQSKASKSLSVYAGDARSVRIDRSFDTVISLFHVASYQITNSDIQAMFHTATHHLHAGGLFLFDVWYGPAVLAQQPAVRIKRLENEHVYVTRLAEPTVDVNANRVDVNYTMLVEDKASRAVASFTECHPMRYYFTPELELIAAAAGMELLHSEEWLTAEVPSQHTWSVTFVARRIATNTSVRSAAR